MPWPKLRSGCRLHTFSHRFAVSWSILPTTRFWYTACSRNSHTLSFSITLSHLTFEAFGLLVEWVEFNPKHGHLWRKKLAQSLPLWWGLPMLWLTHPELPVPRDAGLILSMNEYEVTRLPLFGLAVQHVWLCWLHLKFCELDDLVLQRRQGVVIVTQPAAKSPPLKSPWDT